MQNVRSLSLGVALAVCMPLAGAVEVPFATVAPVSTGTIVDARSTRIADFDQDGDMDVVAAAQTAGVVTWFENTAGDGSAWTPHEIDNDFGNVIHLEIVDVNGDSYPDVVASRLSTNVGQDSVVWYVNDRTPANDTAWVLQQVAVGLLVPQQFAIGDMDRDGDVDVVVAHTGQTFNPVGNEILWYEQVDTKGSAWVPHIVDAAFALPISVAVGDLNGDGFLDIVGGSGSTGAGVINWYLNDGNPAAAAAWAEASVDGAFNGPATLFVYDMNGDGINDVLAAGEEQDEVAWWRNPGNQIFVKESVDATLVEASRAIPIDFDGDGDIDVVGGSDNQVTNPADDFVIWWENTNGIATAWTRRPIVDGTFDRLSGVSAADIDGDGDVDVTVASRVSDSVTWFEATTIHGTAAFVAADSASTTATAHTATGDFDGDGDVDLVGSGVGGTTIAWYRNEGIGGSWNEATVDTSLSGAGRVVSGDFDGDGQVDIAAVASGENLLTYWSNTAGTGVSWTEDPIDTFLTGASALATGDFDRDGNTDIVSGGTGGAINFYENRLDLSQGWTNHNAATGFTNLSDLVAADFNGDGALDIAGVSTSLNAVRWWESDGTPGGPGSFTERAIVSDLTGATSVAAGDVDRDGDMDLVAGGSGAIRVYRNDDGLGGSWTASDVSSTDGASSVVLLDFDDDGDLDVAAADTQGNRVQLLLNDGTGASWTPGTATPMIAGATGLAAADIDGAGRMDLAASGTGGTVALPNVGGQFTLDTEALAIADDSDGATVTALKIDATHSGRVGDSGVQLGTLDLGITNSVEAPLTSTEANNLIDRLFITLDDGNGLADGGDTELATVASLTLDGNGRTAVALPANANTQLAAGESKTYFVSVDLAADASAQMPGAFKIVHNTASTSTGSDLVAAIDLRLTALPNLASGIIAPGGDPADVNLDGSVNAIDIQLVINRVLGTPIPPFDARADIDNSGTANSVDIQLVINAVLGV